MFDVAQQLASPKRPRIALITNHGYAGVEIPVGGAPDTGGQNFYVNSLAQALDEIGFSVTIFARGGFPFFESTRMRQGTDYLTENVRYVYVPGGPNEFIRKEDIAFVLDEETAFLQEFIAEEAANAGCKPWEYYAFLNTHYWDAAIIGVKLIERWQDQAALAFLAGAAQGALSGQLGPFEGDEAHRRGLSREIDLHLGQIAEAELGPGTPEEIAERLVGRRIAIEPELGAGPGKQELTRAICLGRSLGRALEVDGRSLHSTLQRVNAHVWTPHSVGIVKERNFWNKEAPVVRSLKFRERDAHEQVVCRRTPLFCSTSSAIWRSLVSYHGVSPRRVFDFPPCIDSGIFHPRKKSDMDPQYRYLHQASGVDMDTLKQAKIVFETSRMDKTKRKDVLLRAFAKVAENNDQVYLFIGGGPSTSPVFEELKRLHNTLPSLRGRAFLLGYIPEEIIEPLFSLADLFVSASEMEGFGMSVSQAAAAGAAIVTSDLIPFATQYAQDAAVVVPAGDVDGFASAMERLLTDDMERERRAVKLHQIAQSLDWNSTAARFIKWASLNLAAFSV